MNHEQVVQHAVLCLQALDDAAKPLTPREISSRQGIPLPECARILRQLCEAGILLATENGRMALNGSVEEVTSMDLLEAVWGQPEPFFRMWVGGQEGPRFHKTVAWVTQDQVRAGGCEING
jgi:DNA-binding IscR family transcriptional regulator